MSGFYYNICAIDFFRCKACGNVFGGFSSETPPRCPNCGGFCVKL